MPIDPHAHLDASARVAPDCVIKSGAYIGSGVLLESGVYVGANVAFVDLPSGYTSNHTKVQHHATIGANSTIYSGVVIGAKAEVLPGSVVTRSVPPNAIVEGNPANIVGYVDAIREQPSSLHRWNDTTKTSVETTAVKGVTVHELQNIPDLRGNLTVGEFDRQVPFIPKRYFMVFDVPSREIRGEHAHYECHQFLICLHGNCAVVVDDGSNRVEITLDAPNRGLYLPPMTWGIQYKYSQDALLLVFASEYYDAADYIRDYAEFIEKLRTS